MPRRSLVHQAVPLVTTLPASPVDGQIVDFLAIYNAGSDAVTWRLRYRASSGYAYKWEFVGGPAMYAPAGSSTAVGNITLTTTNWTALTGGPTLTVPLAGDYTVGVGATMQSQAGGAMNMNVGWMRNGTAIDSAVWISQATFDGGGVEFRRHAPSGLAKNDVLSVAGSQNALVNAVLSNGYLDLTPIRLGPQ
jgi:hypothetical protein